VSAARVTGSPGPARLRSPAVRRIVVAALALSMLSGTLRPARASGEDGTAESKVGVMMAMMCGFALRLAIPAPVPWAGIAAAACTFAFLDAAASPDKP
jgi:hypothetical protein